MLEIRKQGIYRTSLLRRVPPLQRPKKVTAAPCSKKDHNCFPSFEEKPINVKSITSVDGLEKAPY